MMKMMVVSQEALEVNLQVTADMVEEALRAPLSHDMRVASVMGALHGMVIGLVIDFPALRPQIERLASLLGQVYE